MGNFKKVVYGSVVSFMLSMVINPASAEVLDPFWSGGGTGTTTVVSDGTNSPALFEYDNPGVFSGNWNFQTVASNTRIVVLKYEYSGFHAFFQVTAELSANVGSVVYPLVDEGPINCCTSPSNFFSYEGYVVLPVNSGDMYGLSMSGSHFDRNRKLQGTLLIDELNKDDCKKGGWQTYSDANGQPLFKNQGDCVSFVSTGGSNGPG